MSAADLSARVPLTDLIGHCARYMSDRAVASDFETVTQCAASEADAEALARYRRARMRAPGFAPGSWSANSHRGIPPEVLRDLVEPGQAGRGSELTCSACGRRFTARRADARACSDRCRKRRSRSVPTAVVTALAH